MRCNRRQFTKTALLSGLAFGTLSGHLSAQANYVVKRGDTLGQIAQQFGVSTHSLKQANNISGDLIQIGQKLTIPSGGLAESAAQTMSHHIVGRGDTLGAIAIRYGVTVNELKIHNGLNNDVIRIGQKLNIPASSSPKLDLLATVRTETADINVRRDNWQRIVVHHSGIKYGNATKYDAAHRRRGMQNGLAYHFLIGNGIDSGDGEIEVGPRWKKQLLGGHVKSYKLNLTAIGICLIGNFEKTHPSRRQLDAFTQLMEWLQGDVLRKKTHFAGHRELKGEQTICPGKNFPLAAMHARYS
ncbi:MAG: LysM peptidoglycan-binding domain-containing protein [Verrucomicrobiota bacterium]